MGYKTPRPPVPGETEKEALERDIEYYGRNIRMFKTMSLIAVSAIGVLLLILLAVHVLKH